MQSARRDKRLFAEPSRTCVLPAQALEREVMPERQKYTTRIGRGRAQPERTAQASRRLHGSSAQTALGSPLPLPLSLPSCTPGSMRYSRGAAEALNINAETCAFLALFSARACFRAAFWCFRTAPTRSTHEWSHEALCAMCKENVHRERRRSCEPSELSAASCPSSPPAVANSATRAHDTLQKERYDPC